MHGNTKKQRFCSGNVFIYINESFDIESFDIESFDVESFDIESFDLFLPVASLIDFIDALNPNARTHMGALKSLAAVKTEMMKIATSVIEYGASGQSPVSIVCRYYCCLAAEFGRICSDQPHTQCETRCQPDLGIRCRCSYWAKSVRSWWSLVSRQI